MMQLQIDSAAATASSSSASTKAATSSTPSQAQSDMAKVASSLKSGDLSGAQNAFAKFETDAAAAFKKKQESSSSTNASTPSASEIEAQALSEGSTFSVTV